MSHVPLCRVRTSGLIHTCGPSGCAVAAAAAAVCASFCCRPGIRTPSVLHKETLSRHPLVHAYTRAFRWHRSLPSQDAFTSRPLAVYNCSYDIAGCVSPHHNRVPRNSSSIIAAAACKLCAPCHLLTPLAQPMPSQGYPQQINPHNSAKSMGVGQRGGARFAL